MARQKSEIRYDAQGVELMMRKRDYMADMAGMFGMNLVANLIGQLSYFYTDKVGLAVGGVGIVMLIAKIVDAVTDLWFGNVIDHSKGGNKKYYRWILRMMFPYSILAALLFCVPIQAGQVPALIYACVTNILLSAVCGTLMGTPMSAVMVVRTNSQRERESMGVFRAVGAYGSGMVIAILTIPITNVLGGNQNAWIKYGFIVALVVLLMLSICYMNGRKARLVEETSQVNTEDEEEAIPLKESIPMLFRNKYWIILVLFNLITQITNSITSASGNYYCKWIFGDDNLVALAGSMGFFATILGFVLSKPVIAKLGVRKTIDVGVLGAAVTAAIRCFVPANFQLYLVMGLIGSFVQIPLMCLYGVLLAMVIDYNEYTYHNKLVGVSSGAIGIGTKIGAGIGSVILMACLKLGGYDPDLAVATTSMRYAIYAFSNYLPLIINLGLFVLFRFFDLEEKLPAIRAELAERRSKKDANQ